MISANPITYSADRVLMLKPIDGKPLNSAGIIDPSLFKEGENANRLHAVMDSETCLWHFKYEKGALPPALKNQTFTGFRQLKKHADDYFNSRNITIEVINPKAA